jgi:phosphoglucomutase
MINKDQSIVMQVAAKIAADLVGRDGDINQRICDWVVAHDAVYEHLSNQHGWTGTPTVEQVIPEHDCRRRVTAGRGASRRQAARPAP